MARFMTRPINTTLAALLVALCAIIPVARAQPDAGERQGVFAYAEPERTYLGSPVRFVIVLENLADAEPPEFDLDWATVAYQGASQFSSTSVRIVNGQPTREAVTQVQLQYALTPTESGVFVVPAQTVRAGGQAFETQPVRITVLEPETAPGGELYFDLSDTEVWLGEAVPAELVWALPDLGSADVSGFEFGGSPPERVDIEPSGSNVTRGSSRYREIPLWGKRAVGRIGTRMIEGRRATTFTVELNLIPTEAGDITIDPVTVVFDVTAPGARAPVRMMQRSEPTTLRVKPLPTQDRPDTFTGLVGRFAISATAEPRAVNVGDPIDLFVTIRGAEPMRGVRTGPDLAPQPAWRNFRLSPDAWRFEPGGEFGERLFKTTVRAGNADIDEIPPIELAYFDPEAGEYRVARSAPIPLEVRAVREVTAADAVVSQGAAPAPGPGITGPNAVARSPLEANSGGVWANDLGPAVLAADAFTARDALESPVFLALLAVPPAIWAFAGLARGVRTRRDPAVARRLSARPVALRTLRSRGIAPAIRAFVGRRFGLATKAVTAADCREHADRTDSDAGRELARLLARAEAAEFTGQPLDRADRAEAARLIRAFDRDASAQGPTHGPDRNARQGVPA